MALLLHFSLKKKLAHTMKPIEIAYKEKNMSFKIHKQ